MRGIEATTRGRVAGVLALALLGVAAAGSAEGPRAEPLSPGAAALLLDGKVAALELAQWAALLADQRPLARATAARLATVSGAAPLVPALLAALDKEIDPGAAREEMIALGRLAPGDSDDALFRAAGRFVGKLDGVLARSLALRGAAALALAPRLAGLPIVRPDWAAYISWTTGDGREGLDAAASAALSSGAPPAWAALLALARDEGAAVDEATLARSLESPSPAIREKTYWHLARSGNPRPAEAPALARALAAAPEAQDSATGKGVVGHELASRALGREARDRTALIEALPPSDRALLPAETAVLRLLRGEREAYGRARFGEADAVATRLKAGRGPRGNVMKPPRERPTIVRTASDLPAQLSRPE